MSLFQFKIPKIPRFSKIPFKIPQMSTLEFWKNSSSIDYIEIKTRKVTYFASKTNFCESFWSLFEVKLVFDENMSLLPSLLYQFYIIN